LLSGSVLPKAGTVEPEEAVAATKQLGKHITATQTHTTTEELLGCCAFYVACTISSTQHLVKQNQIGTSPISHSSFPSDNEISF
jgi:hypothetical protein